MRFRRGSLILNDKTVGKIPERERRDYLADSKAEVEECLGQVDAYAGR